MLHCQGQAPAGQRKGGVDGGDGVLHLVQAHQWGVEAVAVVDKAVAQQVGLFHQQLGQLWNYQGTAFLPAAGGNHILCARGLPWVGYHQAAPFDNTALFKGDGLHRIPQQLGMVQPNGAEDGGQGRVNGVGGVEASPKPHLQHHHVGLLPGVVEQGQCGDEFKLPWSLIFGLHQGGGLRHLAGQPGQLCFGNHFAVQHNPLPEVHHKGGGVAAGAVARRPQNGGQHHRCGALAVGARHMDKPQLLLGVAQLFQQQPDAGQLRLAPKAVEVVDVVQSLVVVHSPHLHFSLYPT